MSFLIHASLDAFTIISISTIADLLGTVILIDGGSFYFIPFVVPRKTEQSLTKLSISPGTVTLEALYIVQIGQSQ